MKNPFLLLLLLLLGQSSGLSAEPADLHPDLTLHKGNWKLEIVYRQKGTKNESQRGRLFYKNQEFESETVGEETKTDLGLMKFYGKNAKQPFLPAGWNFADHKKQIPSTALVGCSGSGIDITGDLAGEDIQAIVKAVAKETSGKIIGIQQFKPNSAEVTTGVGGAGMTFNLEKKDGVWVVIQSGHWVA